MADARPRLTAGRSAALWLFERLTQLLWPLPALLALALAAALLDLPRHLPGWPHVLLLAAWLGALAAVLLHLRHLRRPTARQLARRRHGPATPRPRLAAADPLGLRFLPWLLLAVALSGGGHHPADRLERLLHPDLSLLGGPPPQLRLTLVPPAYSGLPSLPLSGATPPRTVPVPQGTRLLARLSGGQGEARLRLGADWHSFTASAGGEAQTLDLTLERGGPLVLRQGWRDLGRWTLAVRSNPPPALALAAPVGADDRRRLHLALDGHDAAGIDRLWLILRRADEAGGPYQVIPLPLEGAPTRLHWHTDWEAAADVWAGHPVSLRLAARDRAGGIAFTAPLRLALPARPFTDAAAQALLQQRRLLAQAPDDRLTVLENLTVLAEDPRATDGDLLTGLALADACARLRWDDSPTAIPDLLALLWQTALRLEDGAQPLAHQRFDEAARRVEQDMAAPGTPPAVLQQALSDYRDSLERLLTAMAETAQRHGLTEATFPPVPDALSMGGAEELLTRLQDLALAGRRPEAEAILKRLDDTTAAFARTLEQARPDLRRRDALRRALSALDSLLARQQAVLTRLTPATDGGAAAPSALDAEEDRLHAALAALLAGLPAADAAAAPALPLALLSMSDAAHALRDHRPGDAQAAAAQTLTRLEEGRRQTANGLRRSLGLDQDGLPRDPLGRVLAVDGDSVAVQIPADGDMAAAQAVLAALRQTHTPPPPRPLSLSERLLRLLRDRI
ncbi:hypothetical protein GALL_356320 [mine drainage metagenome]|uniref:DUF4175 domain-containing protein n=1 Tax=mine drainage metagenome TaxID=410659 RepID=A0A1J5QYQ3_9ZZZZ